MLRLVDGEALEAEAAAVADAVESRRPTALCVGPAADHPRLVAAIVRRLDSPLVATVPASLDQVSETVLELASGLEADDRRRVDQALRDAQRAPDTFGLVLDRLRDAADERPIVVDRIDRLSIPARDSLRGALAPQVQQLARWITEHGMLVTSPSVVHRDRWQTRTVRGSATPTVRLVNGGPRESTLSWDEGADAKLYGLALALEALEGGPSANQGEGPSLGSLGDESLRDALWHALPEGVRALLQALAVHARPLPRSLCGRIEGFDPISFERGTELGLWTERAEQVVADDGWCGWFERVMPRLERARVHGVLARALQSAVDPGDGPEPLDGLALLGAQRHLLDLGQLDPALRYAKYGLELFVELARRRSEDGDFHGAAELYAQLLARADLSPRLRGYVRHYLHYNRAHERPPTEGFAHTAAGYEDAVRDWPENALFWSRTVRAWVLADDLGRARSCLHRATSAVPQHPQRDALLFARAARRLVELSRPFEALALLGDYTPANHESERARAEFDALCHALEHGWKARVIGLAGEEAIFLHRDVRCRVLRSDEGWQFVADELGSSRRYARAWDAIREVVNVVREEARSLCARSERELGSDERQRRTLLLSLVDLRASGLDQSVRVRWVLGTLRRHGEALQLEAHDSAARFEVPAELAKTLTVDDDLVLAQVEARTSDSADSGTVVAVRRCVRVNDTGSIELDLRPSERSTDAASWTVPPRTVGPSPSDFSALETIGDPHQDR